MSGARAGRATAPARPQPREERRHLRLVTEPGTGVRPRTLGMFAVGLFLVAVFVIASLHALLVQGQLELDELDEQLQARHEYAEELDQRIAHLESPDRIVAEATALGLVVPSQVVYLEPVLPGDASTGASTPEIAADGQGGTGEVEEAEGAAAPTDGAAGQGDTTESDG
ncbi:MAG: hypothetical protein S0880_09360 [Actinomycetota bacterium]|nr:hypothetical protein [Actinomycetota bacterium]